MVSHDTYEIDEDGNDIKVTTLITTKTRMVQVHKLIHEPSRVPSELVLTNLVVEK